MTDCPECNGVKTVENIPHYINPEGGYSIQQYQYCKNCFVLKNGCCEDGHSESVELAIKKFHKKVALFKMKSLENLSEHIRADLFKLENKEREQYVASISKEVPSAEKQRIRSDQRKEFETISAVMRTEQRDTKRKIQNMINLLDNLGVMDY